jgi:Malonyl-CoA decarboxylase C-terminal domain
MKSTTTLGWTSRVLQAYLHQLVERIGPLARTTHVDPRHDRVRRRIMALLTRMVHGEVEQPAMRRPIPLSSELPPRIARDLISVYRELPVHERAGMVAIAADDLSSAEPVELKAKIELLSAAMDAAVRTPDQDTVRSRLLSGQHSLRNALIPPYFPLLEAMLREPGGLETVVLLRGDALHAANPHISQARSSRERDALRLLAEDLRQILRTHISGSTLVLRTITSESSENVLLRIAETSARYSPHPVEGVEDLLSNRLGTGHRHVYALFHHLIKNEPLVFIEVAIFPDNNMPSSMQDIFHTRHTCHQRANTAIFYSITAAQPGLAGMDLGGELIKRVVSERLTLHFTPTSQNLRL